MDLRICFRNLCLQRNWIRDDRISMLIELKLLLLLLVANGTPLMVGYLLQRRLDYPLDGHLEAFDGRPLLGPSKTIRGIVSAVVVTAIAASVLGLTWQSGALVGGLAMCGDLISSFIKRRLGMSSSSMALGLDQVPEALLPLWIFRESFGLNWASVAYLVVAFFILELVLSRILYRLHVRKQPY